MDTIDINAKEWFDKANGNSYFSAEITIDYGLPTAKTYILPFQYGYGEHYIDCANEYLMKQNIIPTVRYENGVRMPLRMRCEEDNIILRTSKQEKCLKRDMYKPLTEAQQVKLEGRY